MGQRAGDFGLVRHADRFGGFRLMAFLRIKHWLAVHFQKADARCTAAISSARLPGGARDFPRRDGGASHQYLRGSSPPGAAGRCGITGGTSPLLVLVAKEPRPIIAAQWLSSPGRSNTNTSASFPLSMCSPVSRVIRIASPALRTVPLAVKLPRATCT